MFVNDGWLPTLFFRPPSHIDPADDEGADYDKEGGNDEGNVGFAEADRWAESASAILGGEQSEND